MIATMSAPDVSPASELYAADVAKRRLVGIQEARDHFRALVDNAVKDDEHTVVARRGKAVVAVVPIEWYRRMAELDGEPTEL
uniref:type II toxin-antitoxin system Phd/YefM family antitoxin n=1 Tax=Paractinoplanes polyasparticus TaxID=2856853 RepID=UPI001C863273|nr:type II toxin-antitoxin system Phd/YefM family antitoxin [Actinoplanes polyasparticus]